MSVPARSTRVKRALLYTSFVISLARGEDIALEDPPEEAAISAATLCGLHHDVLAATDEQRPGRLANHLRRATIGSPPHRHTRRAVLRPAARRGQTTPREEAPNSRALIAATAAAHDIPLITRDRDFADLDLINAIIV